MSNTLSASGLPDVISFSISIPVALAAVETLISAVVAAAAALPPDPRIDEIVATMKRIEIMSATNTAHTDALTASVAKLSGDFSTFRTDLTAGIADLKAQIAAGGTVDFGPVDAATAKLDTMDTDLAAASAELAAARSPSGTTPPVTHTPTDTSDNTPNSTGGRNNFFLADFDASFPETA